MKRLKFDETTEARMSFPLQLCHPEARGWPKDLPRCVDLECSFLALRPETSFWLSPITTERNWAREPRRSVRVLSIPGDPSPEITAQDDNLISFGPNLELKDFCQREIRDRKSDSSNHLIQQFDALPELVQLHLFARLERLRQGLHPPLLSRK
jgi:hypothetical protein